MTKETARKAYVTQEISYDTYIATINKIVAIINKIEKIETIIYEKL